MKYIVSFFMLLYCLIGYGQEVYNIDTTYPVHDLMTSLNIIEDPNEELSVEDVLMDSTLSFKKRNEFGKHLNITSTYWGKFRVITLDSLKDWTLHFEDKFIGPPAWTKSNGKVDVFAFTNNQPLFHKKTGVEYTKKDRDVKNHWILNQVSLEELPPKSLITIIIKVRGNQLGYPPYFNLTARSPKQPHYHQIYQFNNSFNLFLFGVTFIIFLYHLLQYFYLKESVFLWFSIWLLFCVITQAMTIGFFIGSITTMRFPLQIIISNGVFYSWWFFGRSFINSKHKFPKLDKIILSLSYFLIAEILITVIFVSVFDTQPIFLNIGIHFIVLCVYSFLSLIISVLLLLKSDLFAKYFGFGSIIFSLFLIAGTFWSLGIISPIKNFADPYATGMFLQIVIYSFGIAFRQQQLAKKTQNEKQLAQEAYSEMLRIKDLDEVKTRFFANISHEFRTPLALISGPIIKAFNSSSNGTDVVVLDKKSYEIVKNNTSRLQNLVDQLLDLSKLESGKVHLSLKQGGLIQFLRSIIFSFESMAERNNISLNTSFPEEIDFAFYDKDKLEKIVTNILSNAFKYNSNTGTITVTIVNDLHYINLEISDTGKGMSKDEVKRIFERFYRVESSEEKGSGIGLALTKELVDLHNGKISVDSVKHKGTTFKVRLPISLDNLPRAISFTETTKTKPKKLNTSEDIFLETNSLTTNAKELPVALIVEDNQDLQYFISDILKQHYIILTAKDGMQGERMAFEHIPDIIVSDIMMPKMDGYMLCNSLKANPKTSHIPIILLTAKAGHEHKMEGLTQGADAYLTKPFDDKELLLRMKNLIASRKKLWEHFKALDMLLVDDIDVSSIDDKFLQDVFKTIKNNLDNEHFGVEDIAKQVGFSRSQLHRKLKALSDKSANQLITEIRLNEAHRMLTLKTGTVSEVAYSVGYSNLSYFTKSFKEKFGKLPSKI
ncbi:ATP-binding protein [Pontimicrobium sp. SW4]|uniref:histidine kinase n=1 Tax=Pontimicrobium sp. SW4 TaxID=3153519 RepID=A0AAU7BNH0_9FLAO